MQHAILLVTSVTSFGRGFIQRTLGKIKVAFYWLHSYHNHTNTLLPHLGILPIVQLKFFLTLKSTLETNSTVKYASSF